MSKDSAFFNPQSLLRVARAVEWEPDLVAYKNGTSNQGCYMNALASLYGQWLSGDTIPWFLDQATRIEAKDWSGAIEAVIDRIPLQVNQLVGWWTGFAGGILPKKKWVLPIRPGWPFSSSSGEIRPDVRLANNVSVLVDRLSSIILPEVSNGEAGGGD